MKGLTRDRKKTSYLARPIKCSKCGATRSICLEKVDDHYQCQNITICYRRQLITPRVAKILG